MGADVAGRYTLPTAKTAVQTTRGPRGPINIEHSKQLNLPLSGGRNTGGLDETGKAMLPYIQEGFKRKTRRTPFFPIGAKNVPKGLTNPGTNRGLPYSGPHLTAEEGLKRLVPLRKGKFTEPTWYQDPRTGELFQYHYGEGALARGFYKRGKNNVDIPQYAKRAADEFNPNKIGARTPTKEGIMNTSPGKSYMEKLGDLRLLEQRTNRRNFLEDATRREYSKIQANEAPSKNFQKMLEELAELNRLLD